MADQHFTPEELASEEWRPVVEFPAYHVSNLGRVRNNAGLVLRTYTGKKGYLSVTLYGPSVRRNRYVHRLVMVSFVGDVPAGLEINHEDGSKANNRLSNLSFVTPSENCRHAIRIGLVPAPTAEGLARRLASRHRGDSHYSRMRPELVLRGNAVGTAKLAREDVVEMRRLRAIGVRFTELSALYNVSEACARLAVIGKTWAHL